MRRVSGLFPKRDHIPIQSLDIDDDAGTQDTVSSSNEELGLQSNDFDGDTTLEPPRMIDLTSSFSKRSVEKGIKKDATFDRLNSDRIDSARGSAEILTTYGTSSAYSQPTRGGLERMHVQHRRCPITGKTIEDVERLKRRMQCLLWIVAIQFILLVCIVIKTWDCLFEKLN